MNSANTRLRHDIRVRTQRVGAIDWLMVSGGAAVGAS